MLFECEGRSGKIEIGNAEKEGEYSLTFSFSRTLTADEFSTLMLVVLRRL